MKNSFKALLLCLLALALTVAPAFAQKTGQPDDDFSYMINNNEVTITGYAGPGGDLIIPAKIADYPVTAIEPLAFAHRKDITSLDVRSENIRVKDGGFSSMDNLEKVTFSGGRQTRLDGAAFSQSSLTEPHINGSATIGQLAFHSCSNLKKVTVTGNCQFGVEAFSMDWRLESVEIGGDCGNVGNSAFKGCKNLSSFKVGGVWGSIGGDAFNDTQISGSSSFGDSNFNDNTDTSESGGVPVYRLYNPNTAEHLYTVHRLEADALIEAGWADEGAGWASPAEGDPVYRLYCPSLGEHLYTTNKGEADALAVSGAWTPDFGGEAAFRSGGSTPVYRLYNGAAGRHHLTTNAGEYDLLATQGWSQEGVAMHGI